MCWAAVRDSDTAHAVNMLTYTYTNIRAETLTHTGAHTHTAGPSQLTPRNCTDHIRGSGEKGGHMWMMVHANKTKSGKVTFEIHQGEYIIVKASIYDRKWDFLCDLFVHNCNF